MKKTTKKRTNKDSSFLQKIIIFFLLLIIIALSAFIGGYIFNEKKTIKEIHKYQNTLQTLQQKIDKLSSEINKNNIKKSPPLNLANVSNIINFPVPKKRNISKKPKLVIIIDDVAFKFEINLIKQIPYKITPSFFPATKRHPYTPTYAKEFKDYMVHVPMEAFNYAHPEPNTLLANSSYWTIKKRIEQIKKEFPKAKFINNHTGSKFTSTYTAMNYLFEVLKEEHLGFVDSKTTPLSKSYEVNKIYKIPLFSRDIFLDDKENPAYIKNQLKKAVRIAKRKGYSIAIGHPHKITLETLKNSKKLLNQVDVIYIDELSKYAKN